MGIYIKGAGMPAHCGECPCEQEEYGYCQVFDGKHFCDYESRPEWCPLVEIKTPHGRLVDADAEAKKLGLDRAVKYGNKDAEQQYFSYSTMMMYEIRDIFDDAPTVVESEG